MKTFGSTRMREAPGFSPKILTTIQAGLLILAPLAVLWLALAPMGAQTVSIYSSIVGTITDSSGASVPGAVVTVTNPSTAISISATTNEQGLYHVDPLALGTYNLSVKRQGFKDVESNGIVLSSGQEFRADFALQIGTVGQSVTVAAAAPLINLENPQISNSFDWNARKYLPVSVPSGTVLPDLNPATTLSGTNANVFSFAGSLQNEYDYQINGVSFAKNGIPAVYIEWADQNNISYVNNDAQYQSQAVMDLVMKSGTNQWHGSVVDYYSAGGLANSNNTFSTTRPSYVRHIFASSISFPIIKDRMFFYGGVASSPAPGRLLISATVPTGSQASGNFSGAAPIIDPTTGLQFPGNMIPAGRINSVSSAFLKEFYPSPNVPNAVSNSQTFVVEPLEPQFNPYTRVDYKISDKNSLSGDWNMIEFGGFSPSGATLPAVGGSNGSRVDQLFGLTDAEAFTPALLNEFGIGFSRTFTTTTGQQLGSTIVQNIGLQGVPLLPFPGIPPMSIAGFTTAAQSSYSRSNFDTYTLRDTVSWTHGRHTMKFGFAAAQNRSGSYPTQPDNAFGSFSFTSVLPGGTGNALANFLLGLPTTESRQLEYFRQHFRYNTDQAFVQDTYEVSHNLTLNVGIRYEYHQPPYETGGLTYNVNLANGDIILSSAASRNLVTPQVLNNPAFTFVTASQAGYPTHLYSINQANFAPRLGVAYRFDDKTVVRAGYGLFYDFTPPQATPSDLFTVIENFTPNSITKGVPAYSFPNPFAGANASAVGTLGASSYAKNIQMPYTQQWSLTVERQILSSMAARISYIGSHTAEQLYGYPANIPAPSTTPFTQSRRPLPQFGQMTAYQSGADANYNSLATQLQYRSESGMYASASFTWAHNLGIDGQNSAPVVIENPFDLAADYGDVVNPSIVAQGLFRVPLPVGRGRTYLSSGSRPVDAIAGGWNLTGDVILRSGDHLTPSYAGYDSTGTGIVTALTNATLRPDVIGNPNLPPGQRSITRWFNAGAFAYPGANPATPLVAPSGPVGRFGNAGVGIIEGPGYAQLDLGLAKEISVWERLKVGLFILGSNALNHPNFADPNLVISAPTTAATITALKKDQNAATTACGQCGNRDVSFGLRIEF